MTANAIKPVSKNRRAAASSAGGSASAVRQSDRQSLTRPKSALIALGSIGAVSGASANRAQDLRKAGTAAESRSSAHPESRSKLTGTRLKRTGPPSWPSAIASNPSSAAVTARLDHLDVGPNSAAARRDQDPIWVGGSGVACKGPVIGLLGRVFRVAVDDASVHRAGHIYLLRNKLCCQLCRAS